MAALGAETLIGGRGPVVRGAAAVEAAIAPTRGFPHRHARADRCLHAAGGTLRDAFLAAHTALAPRYGSWPIFEHCLPFKVQRLWDELDGIDWPRLWTAERDRDVWGVLPS